MEIRCPDTDQVIPSSSYNTSTDIALSPYTGKVFDLSGLKEISEQISNDQDLLNWPMEGVEVLRHKKQVMLKVSARSPGHGFTLLLMAIFWIGFSVLLFNLPMPHGSSNAFVIAIHSIFGIGIAIGGATFLFGFNEIVLDSESLVVRHGLRFLKREIVFNRDSIRSVFVCEVSRGSSENEPTYCLSINAKHVTRCFSGVKKNRLEYIGALLRSELDLYRITTQSHTGERSLAIRCPDTDAVIPSDQLHVCADAIKSPFTGKTFKLSQLLEWQRRHDADLAIVQSTPYDVRVARDKDQITMRISSAALINPYTIWLLAAGWNSAIAITLVTSTNPGSFFLAGGTSGMLMILAVIIGMVLLLKSLSRTFGSLVVTVHNDWCTIVNHTGLVRSKERFDGRQINSIVIQGWRDMSYEKLTPSGGYIVVNVISTHGDYFFAKTRELAVVDYIAAMMRLHLRSFNQLDEIQDDLPLGQE